MPKLLPPGTRLAGRRAVEFQCWLTRNQLHFSPGFMQHCRKVNRRRAATNHHHTPPLEPLRVSMTEAMRKEILWQIRQVLGNVLEMSYPDRHDHSARIDRLAAIEPKNKSSWRAFEA